MEYLRRHKCRHNPGGSNKSSILPLEDYKGNIIGEVMTREQKIDFERRHSQVLKLIIHYYIIIQLQTLTKIVFFLLGNINGGKSTNIPSKINN